MSFYQPENLPKIMIAPNGARPKKKDHIEVPVTIDEVVETAKYVSMKEQKEYIFI